MELGAAFRALFKKEAQGKKTLHWATALGLAGMLLILLTGLLPAGEGRAAKASGQTAQTSSQQFAQHTEQQLAQLLCKAAGVGETHVMVTVEQGAEYRYAADEKSSGDSVATYAGAEGALTKQEQKQERQQSYILVESGQGKQPLVLTELAPKVKGVVVICRGGGSAVTKQRVTDIVTTALGISSIQVCVIEAAQ